MQQLRVLSFGWEQAKPPPDEQRQSRKHKRVVTDSALALPREAAPATRSAIRQPGNRHTLENKSCDWIKGHRNWFWHSSFAADRAGAAGNPLQQMSFESSRSFVHFSNIFHFKPTKRYRILLLLAIGLGFKEEGIPQQCFHENPYPRCMGKRRSLSSTGKATQTESSCYHGVRTRYSNLYIIPKLDLKRESQSSTSHLAALAFAVFLWT